MKSKTFFPLLIAGVFTLFTNTVFAQTTDSTSTVVNTVDNNVQPVPAQSSSPEQDKERLAAARKEAKEAKRQARETEKMDDAAEEAAKKAKRSARLEAKAQRTRKKADKAASKVGDN